MVLICAQWGLDRSRGWPRVNPSTIDNCPDSSTSLLPHCGIRFRLASSSWRSGLCSQRCVFQRCECMFIVLPLYLTRFGQSLQYTNCRFVWPGSRIFRSCDENPKCLHKALGAPSRGKTWHHFLPSCQPNTWQPPAHAQYKRMQYHAIVILEISQFRYWIFITIMLKMMISLNLKIVKILPAKPNSFKC